jgi:hypothetical protein
MSKTQKPTTEAKVTELPNQMARIIVEKHSGDRYREEVIGDGDNAEIHHFVVVNGDGLYFCDHPNTSVPAVFGDAAAVEEHFMDKVATAYSQTHPEPIDGKTHFAVGADGQLHKPDNNATAACGAETEHAKHYKQITGDRSGVNICQECLPLEKQ